MTPIMLIDELTKFIEEKTKDMILPAKTERGSDKPKERRPEVYKMRPPETDDETNKIPYVVVQYLKSTLAEDNNAMLGYTEKCQIRIIAATYSQNQSEGNIAVLNLLTRIKQEVTKCGMISKQFILKMPVETIIYPDNTEPYYFGEIMTNWEIPVTESEGMNEWLL